MVARCQPPPMAVVAWRAASHSIPSAPTTAYSCPFPSHVSGELTTDVTSIGSAEDVETIAAIRRTGVTQYFILSMSPPKGCLPRARYATRIPPFTSTGAAWHTSRVLDIPGHGFGGP